uniref:Uncharacterized LOC109996339 n=1 Tax=Labrus bergylta TaxID=56723 RepID=A0A3Q3EG50_9LABR|nr:uncharacterized protein LOC109996339 isoform X1 [Labrus bergylta]
MSVALYSASGNNASLHGTTVGGSKPLHRFIKGQPKIIGVIVLILGSSNFILSFSTLLTNSPHFNHIWGVIPPGIVIGFLFNTTGILFILTEHNPTKKTVTISLALSIVTVLGICWTVLHIIPNLTQYHYYVDEYNVDNTTDEEEAKWTPYNEAMERSFEAIFLLYTLMGGIIFVVMSVMAGAALRSTKSQTMIVMTTPTSETQVDQRGQEDGLNCERMSN